MEIYQLLSLEQPLGICGTPSSAIDLDRLLPPKAQDRRWRLLDMFYRQPKYPVDPVILFDARGRILHRWPDDYIPMLAEVHLVCQELEKEDR